MTSQPNYPVLIPAGEALRQLRELIVVGDIIHAVHRKTSRGGAETWDFFVLGANAIGGQNYAMPFIVPIGAKMASALRVLSFDFDKTFFANGGLTLDGASCREAKADDSLTADELMVQMLSGLLFGRADTLRCSRV